MSLKSYVSSRAIDHGLGVATTRVPDQVMDSYPQAILKFQPHDSSEQSLLRAPS